MDVDLQKSATEDQMETMMTMMQVDKLPEFCGSYPDLLTQLSPFELSGLSSGTNIEPTPPIFNNPQVINPSSLISFMGATVQESMSPPPVLFPNTAVTDRLRGGGASELVSGASKFPCPSQKRNSVATMREMIFRIAAMQPIHIDPESVKPPKRRNVKISKDPQSVAARHRRERISERIRILQRLVPGGTKMDTASMLDEAIHYVKFLKSQVQSLERAAANRQTGLGGFPAAMSNAYYSPFSKAYHHQQAQIFSSATQMLS